MFFEIYTYADPHRGWGKNKTVDFIEADNIDQAKAIAAVTYNEYSHGVEAVTRAYVETALVHFEDQRAMATDMVRRIDNLLSREQ